MALVKHRGPTEGTALQARATPPLRHTLVSAMIAASTPAERRAAASQLAGDPEAAGELVAALVREDNAGVRAAMLAALVTINTPEAAAGLAVMVGSNDAGLRNAACDALRDMGDAGRAAVDSLLASPDPGLRIFAVGLLQTPGDARAHERLRVILAREQELNVALAAIEALAQIGGPEDTDALRACAARFSHESFARFAAELACRRLAGGTFPQPYRSGVDRS